MRVQRRSGRVQRSAFTLVELLMVIAIIAILAALTLAGVQRVTVVGKTTRTRSDMSQLSLALDHFKVTYGEYPPHSITFPTPQGAPGTPYNVSAAPAAEQAAVRILSRMFRGYDPNTAIVFRGQTMKGVTITGSQCLVFFLGGPNLNGFAANTPTDPVSGSTSGKAPEFQFAITRLVDPTVSPSNPYFSAYLDPFGTPYAFFSCGAGQTYDTTTPWTVPNRGQELGGNKVSGTPDPSMSTSPAILLTPFKDATGKFANPRTFQIISAGLDSAFGSNPGATWTPGQGDYGQSAPGQDDLSNFSDVPLGTAK